MPGSGQILKVCKTPCFLTFVSFWDQNMHAILINASLTVYTWTVFMFIWNMYDNERFGTLIPCRCLERHLISTQDVNNLVIPLLRDRSRSPSQPVSSPFECSFLSCHQFLLTPSATSSATTGLPGPINHIGNTCHPASSNKLYARFLYPNIGENVKS